MSHQKFIHTKEGYRYKHFIVEDDIYRIIIEPNYWNKASSKAVSYIIKAMKQNIKVKPFQYGYIFKIPNTFIPIIDTCCALCDTECKSRRMLAIHSNNCSSIKWKSYISSLDSSLDSSLNNIVSTEPIPNIVPSKLESPGFEFNISHNNGPINIQNNITICNLGNENPHWLTTNLLYQVLSDIPKAIPKLMEKKHFNDDFPENKNLRVDTRRTIDSRLQVFENGRWRLRDSKQTFYKVVYDIYEVLSDALEEDEPEPILDNSANEHVKIQIKSLRNSERFIKKIEKIRPIWEDFRDTINNQDIRTELWEDLKTLLLDRQLAIEQGFE